MEGGTNAEGWKLEGQLLDVEMPLGMQAHNIYALKVWAIHKGHVCELLCDAIDEVA